ncbi:hypothetical protein RRG08_061020 [Elysia crispata]|uniref:Uncharacterized protein n=1 Tax=Elysia crispata TaxID=231223 RepID=A0AAE1AV58_9GAST|nr:hypothetical protein RRG08_061020 [Elysia crispata]
MQRLEGEAATGNLVPTQKSSPCRNLSRLFPTREKTAPVTYGLQLKYSTIFLKHWLCDALNVHRSLSQQATRIPTRSIYTDAGTRSAHGTRHMHKHTHFQPTYLRHYLNQSRVVYKLNKVLQVREICGIKRGGS